MAIFTLAPLLGPVIGPITGAWLVDITTGAMTLSQSYTGLPNARPGDGWYVVIHLPTMYRSHFPDSFGRHPL